MFGLILGKELREILTTPRFAATFAVVSLLILLAFGLGARNFAHARAQHEAATAENLRQMEGLTDWLRVQPSISLPPQPLASLVTGISNDIGRDVTVMGLGTLRASHSRYGEDPVLAVFRFMDLEFIFQVVLSLFAILFAFDLICGEKERGTLRLALSNAVPRSTWILAKLCGAVAALTLPLLVPLALGGLLLVANGVPMTQADWLRLVLVVACGLLYVAATLGLSVLISTLTQRSSTSFLISLVVWVLLVLAIPRSSVLLAARSVEVPSVEENLSQLGRLRGQLWSEDRKALDAFFQENLQVSDSPIAAEAMVGRFNTFFQQLSEQRSQALEALEARLSEERVNRQAAQQDWSFTWARLSPAAAFSIAATRLAGTALDLPRHFIDQAKAYQQTFERFQKDKTGGRSAGGIQISVRIASTEGDAPPEEVAIDPRELPAFDYQPPPLPQVLRAAAFDLGLLAAFNLLFFSAAFVAFLRYDVR
ncbi:MAG: ABC transporter permease subunit [Acidobacteriota bacterium]